MRTMGVEEELLLVDPETGVLRPVSDRALVAVATPVLRYDDTQVTPKRRYERIVDDFGEIGRQAVVCGTHVHVAVSDDAEGVRVIDGLRPWLPVLRAMSVNSPYWRAATRATPAGAGRCGAGSRAPVRPSLSATHAATTTRPGR